MKKCVYITVIVLLLVGIVIPNVHANVNKIYIKDDDVKVEYGCIYGGVLEPSFFQSEPIRGASLVLEGGGIKKTTISGLILGQFKFDNLPIGHTYTITASHHKYNTKIKTYTLTDDKPSLEVVIHMYPKDKSKTKSINEEPTCFGTILGHTHMKYCWAWCPVPFAKVDAGIKQTISLANGFYILTGLPLGRTYTVTASKRGYHDDTKEVTLTVEEPYKEIYLDLQEKEDYHRNNYFPLPFLARILGLTFSAPRPL
jgi:hypothetical protein